MLIALLVHFQRFAACEVRQMVANATVARPDIRFDPLEKAVVAQTDPARRWRMQVSIER